MATQAFRWPFQTAGRAIAPEAVEAAWREYRATHSATARDVLVQRYVHLVRYMAGRLSRTLPPTIEIEDLVSTGVIGFLAALDGYDPTQGTEFSAYALTRIRGAMVDFIRELDPLGRVTRRRLREMERTLTALEQELAREPSDAEAADRLGISVDAYHEMLGHATAAMTLSLDRVESEGEDEGDPVTRARVPDPRTPSAFEELAEKRQTDRVTALVGGLSSAQQLVLHLHYVEELNFREIAMVMDISESRATQLHSAAVLALRRRAREAPVDPEEVLS